MPDGPAPRPLVQTAVVVHDGGTVMLGGIKAIPVPDGGTILLGGLKRFPGSIAQPAVVVPDGGTVLLGGLNRLR